MTSLIICSDSVLVLQSFLLVLVSHWTSSFMSSTYLFIIVHDTRLPRHFSWSSNSCCSLSWEVMDAVLSRSVHLNFFLELLSLYLTYYDIGVLKSYLTICHYEINDRANFSLSSYVLLLKDSRNSKFFSSIFSVRSSDISRFVDVCHLLGCSPRKMKFCGLVKTSSEFPLLSSVSLGKESESDLQDYSSRLDI